jgi:hypothetical protein
LPSCMCNCSAAPAAQTLCPADNRMRPGALITDAYRCPPAVSEAGDAMQNNSVRLREECPASAVKPHPVASEPGRGYACRAGAASSWQPAATAHPARVQHNESIATAGARGAREAPARKMRGGICADRSAGSPPQHRGGAARRCSLPRGVCDGQCGQALPRRGARRCGAAPRSRGCRPGAPRVPRRVVWAR